jgi:hypothetical protein
VNAAGIRWRSVNSAQLFASADEERLGRNQERTCFQLGKLCKRIIDLAIALGTQNVKLETKTASGRPRTVQSPACGILVNKKDRAIRS